MRRQQQLRWPARRRGSKRALAAASRAAPAARLLAACWVAACWVAACWVAISACGGAETGTSAGTIGTGDASARDSGVVGSRDAAELSPEAGNGDGDGDFGFDELAVPVSDGAVSDAAGDAAPTEPPETFYCAQERFADGAHCDCGCGAPDPDCAGKRACVDAGCDAADCDVRHDETGAALRPASYTCAPSTFDARDGCDCGCGAIDPDCIGDGCTEAGCKQEACQRCRVASGEEVSCRFMCEQARIGDGVCDCGCGMEDPDCGSLGCADPGCIANGCERCQGAEGPLACARGLCPAGFQLDGVCDCGCRELDPDCLRGIACLTPGCSAEGCGRCHDDEGRPIACADWTCTFERAGGGDGCNCGCGAADADCGPDLGCPQPGCAAPGCVTCRGDNGAPMSCSL